MVITVVQLTERITFQQMEHYVMDQLLSWKVSAVKMMLIIPVPHRHAVTT